MPSIADLFVSVTSDVSGAISGLTQVDQKVNGTSAAMSAAAPAGFALAAAAGAVGAAFVSSITVASDFEHQINGIKAVMSPAEVLEFGGAVEDLALKLGKDTVFSSTQAADAIETLIKAGVPLPAILGGAAKSALDLASATGVDVATAAELASGAMNGFHRSAEDLPAIMDAISNVSNATATSVQGLQLAISQVGPVAAGLGISFEDTAQTIGIFAQNLLKGSDAGTSLKTMLLNLEPSTKAQIAAFKELGIITFDQTAVLAALDKLGLQPINDSVVDQVFQLHQAVSGWDGLTKQTKEQKDAWTEAQKSLGLMNNAFFDANGSAKSMRDIFEVLKVATANMTDEQKINVLQTAFGTDAVRAATIAAREGATGWDTVTAAMEKMGGTAVAAAQRNAGLEGSMNQLNGSFETIQINVGQIFLPILTNLVTQLTGVLNAFLTLDPGIQGAIVAVVGIAGAAAGLLAGFILLTPVLTAVGAAFAIIGTAALAVAGPIAALVAAGALLYAAWQTNFGGIRDVTAEVFAAIQPGLDNIGNFIAQVRDALAPAFTAIGDAIGPLIPVVADLVSQLVGSWLQQLPPALRSLGDSFNTLGVAIGYVYDRLNELVNTPQAQAFFSAMRPLAEALGPPLSAIVGFIGNIMGALFQSIDWGRTFLGVVAPGLTDVTSAFNGVLTTIQNVFNSISGIVAGAGDPWAPFINGAWEIGTRLGEAFANFLGFIGQALGSIPGIVAGAGNPWDGFIASAWDIGSRLGEAFANFLGYIGTALFGIPDMISGLGDLWAPFINSAWEIGTHLGDAFGNFLGFIGTALSGIPAMIEGLGDLWEPFITSAWNIGTVIGDAFGNFLGFIGSTLAGIPAWLSGIGMDALWEPFVQSAWNIGTGISDAFLNFWNFIQGAILGIPEWLASIDIFGPIIEQAKAIFQGIVDAIDPIRQLIADTFGNVMSWVSGGTTGGGTTGGGGTPAPAPAPSGGMDFVTVMQTLANTSVGMLQALGEIATAVVPIVPTLIGMSQQSPAPGATPSGGTVNGPLVTIGTVNVGTAAEQDAFLQAMADAILAAAQRLTVPPPSPFPVG